MATSQNVPLFSSSVSLREPPVPTPFVPSGHFPLIGGICPTWGRLAILHCARKGFPSGGRLAILHRARKGFPSGGSCRRSRLMRGGVLIFELHRVFEPKRGNSSERTTLLLIRRFAPPSPQGEGLRYCTAPAKASPQGEGFSFLSRNVATVQNVQPFSSSGASRHLSLPPLPLRGISP